MDSGNHGAGAPVLEVEESFDSLECSLGGAAPAPSGEGGGGSKANRDARIAALLIGVILAFLYAGVFRSLVKVWWNDPDFSHGFFVPLFSGYLLWSGRRKLRNTAIEPSWWGLPLMVAAAAMLVVGTLGAELFLSRCSLVFLISGMVIFFAGWRMFRETVFPISFLLFMIPIPAIIFNRITLPLQLLASQAASYMLPALGVPVLREGNIINLPAMPLEVAEACSGIRSLISLLTLAVAYGCLVERSKLKRVALAVAAAPIAVLANSLRVVGTGLAVQYWNPEKALGFFHEFSGWIIFVVSLFTLLGLHKVMNSGAQRPAPPPGSKPHTAGGPQQ
ncbi:MAG: exosortase/archaeosortase family protein [Acidobacteria bacterium]|nr:exosortase/archaeosortase family protein [Acidobacteriota bacterium]